MFSWFSLQVSPFILVRFYSLSNTTCTFIAHHYRLDNTNTCIMIKKKSLLVLYSLGTLCKPSSFRFSPSSCLNPSSFPLLYSAYRPNHALYSTALHNSSLFTRCYFLYLHSLSDYTLLSASLNILSLIYSTIFLPSAQSLLFIVSYPSYFFPIISFPYNRSSPQFF